MFFGFLIIYFVRNYYVAKQREWSEYNLTEPSGTRSTWNSQKVPPVRMATSPIQLRESRNWVTPEIYTALIFHLQSSTKFLWLVPCYCLSNLPCPFHLLPPFLSKLLSLVTRPLLQFPMWSLLIHSFPLSTWPLPHNEAKPIFLQVQI